MLLRVLMSSVDCRGLLRSIFNQTQQCPGSPPGMSGDFAHINYKSHGWDIQELCYSRIYPRDGNPSSKNFGFVFSNELSRKEWIYDWINKDMPYPYRLLLLLLLLILLLLLLLLLLVVVMFHESLKKNSDFIKWK